MTTVFSIITPTYKSSRFIETLLTCLLEQTYTQWEWLIVPDDGDMSMLNIAARDERIRVLWRSTQQTGRTDARNYGLSHAEGTHIVYLDHDDLLDPKYLEVCAAHFAKSDQLVVTPTHVVDFDSNQCLAKIGGTYIGSTLDVTQYSELLASLHVVAPRAKMPVEVNSFCDDVVRDAQLLYHHGSAVMLDTFYVLRTHNQQITQNVIESDVREQYRIHASEFEAYPELAQVFIRRLTANLEFDKAEFNDWYAYWISRGIWN